ncbi:MAG: AMIN domain-containing protein [Deltaproteobacteria bacterium]|nr:AMIN domain-containing protein [Deltaproteobacteria bacterium]
MKFFSCCLVLFVSLVFSSLTVNCAELPQTVDIKSIIFDQEQGGGESITIKMSDQRQPKIFRIKGDTPRLVLDFPQTLYKGKNIIAFQKGQLASRVRIGVHQNPVLMTRVVVDLSAGREISYKKVFSDGGNSLTINLFSAESKKVEQVKSETASTAVAVEVTSPEEETKESVSPPPAVIEEEPVSQEKVVAAADEGKPRLLEITFDDSSNKGEMVVFRLNDFYPPAVSAVEKETPRVLCDFMDMKLSGDVNKDIFANGKYVERIHTTLHTDPDKVTVTLDLTADRDYDLQQVFFKNDNLFVIIVNELPPEVAGNSQSVTE